MGVHNANLGKIMQSDSDEDFEDRVCFDNLINLDEPTDDSTMARTKKSVHEPHVHKNGTSAWFVLDRPTSMRYLDDSREA